MPKKVFLLILVILINISESFSQTDSAITHSNKYHFQNKDLRDVLKSVLRVKKHDSTSNTEDNKKFNFSFLPGFGYTMQTGFAGAMSGNIGFYNSTSPSARISSISSSITYSEYNQIIFPLYANIWSKNEKYNFISDIKYMSYPSNIFGLGGATDPNKGHTINFNKIKLHQTVLRKITNNLYGGVGFYYDNFFNIKVLDPQTRRINVFIQKEIGTTEVESGPIFKILYDSRKNQINPDKGNYLNLTLRQNLEEVGSSKEWASLLIDARKYINFPKGSNNILALWSFNWLTLAGNPNYLLQPSTGWDDQYNTGRGYIQSRFRGKQMIYFETEYRYKISSNGLLGGVVFANLQNFNGSTRKYDDLLPGYGLGLRIKLNKKSGANLCLDYGFGKGSQGIFVNLGEVF